MACPCKKRLYATYREAVGGVMGGMRKTGASLRIYKCPHTNGYHLTKRRKGEWPQR